MQLHATCLHMSSSHRQHLGSRLYPGTSIYLPALSAAWPARSQMQDEPSPVQACHQACRLHEWCQLAAWHKLKQLWGVTLAGLCRMVRVPVSLHAHWSLSVVVSQLANAALRGAQLTRSGSRTHGSEHALGPELVDEPRFHTHPCLSTKQKKQIPGPCEHQIRL